jgi:hypothetical protein
MDAAREARPGATMTQGHQADNEQEPMGIVISRGSRAEQTPRFTAYVWGPVPDGEKDAPEKLAAV